MAHWTGSEKIAFPPHFVKDSGTWVWADCGCCGGLEWSSGYSPRECRHCKGQGVLCVHLRSGTVAQYPGGPLLGCRYTQQELDHLFLQLLENLPEPVGV